MSQSFKLNYDEMRENIPTKNGASNIYKAKAFEEFYPEESNTRSICFVWQDGKRTFMNYSYLISGEYAPELGTIVLTFTTANFVMTGVNLELLFYDIMNNMAKQITCTDERYNLVGENEYSVVNSIQINP